MECGTALATLSDCMPVIYRKIELRSVEVTNAARLPACRLLFIGGCHAVGYPYGIEYGFPHLALEQLQHRHPSLPLEAHVLAYVPLSRTAEILAGCQEVHPDILVLQLGHYETESAIKRRVRTLLRLPQPARHSGSGSSSVDGSSSSCEPSSSNSSSLANKSSSVLSSRPSRWPTPKRIVKYWLDLALGAAGLPSVDFPRVRQHSRELFAYIAQAGIPHVLVLSPFLALPAMVNRYRRVVGCILREEAAAAGLTYLELDAVFGPALSRRRWELHWDEVHLNELGQHSVAALLTEALEKCLPRELSSAERPRKTVPSAAAGVAS